MSRVSVSGLVKDRCLNRDGVTFLMAIFMVMIIGIMLGLTGQSWKTIMQREREKELLFRGSQIKEAIENWYNPAYKIPGVTRGRVHNLTEMKYLLEDPHTLTPIRYLPHTYGTELDGKNPRCAPDCPKIKLLEDPMTGKEWEIIKCGDIGIPPNEICRERPGTNIIIGVASKSDAQPFRTDFKDTALENMGVGIGPGAGVGTAPVAGLGTSPVTGLGSVPAAELGSGSGAKMTKYSQWKFIADKKNFDHSKINRAYHEGW